MRALSVEALLAALVCVSPLVATTWAAPAASDCTEGSDLVLVCVWETRFIPGDEGFRLWQLPGGRTISIVDVNISTDDPLQYSWGFCVDPTPEGEPLTCPLHVTEDPGATVGSRVSRTVLVDFDETLGYHFMLIPSAAQYGHSMNEAPYAHALIPTSFVVHGRFQALTRSIPAGGHAGTPNDPQLHDALRDAGSVPAADLGGAWLDQPFLDDAIVQIGIVVPNVRDLRPQLREQSTFDFQFELLGEVYVIRWVAKAPSNAHDDGWSAVAFKPDQSPAPQTFQLPHTIDRANGTLSTLVPLALIGDPKPGDLFSNFTATASHSLDVQPGMTATLDDKTDSVVRPFTTGGPAYWEPLRGLTPADPPAAAGEGWAAAPLARENLPVTLLLAGLLVVIATGGAGFAAVRHRISRLAPPTALDERIAPGATVLGKYRVVRELGAGGAGRTFLAEDVRMRRPIVLKELTSGERGAALREARATAAIEHPNVVRVYDVEEIADRPVLVMEYVDGGSLKERLAAGGELAPDAFARLAEQVLAALETVHAAGAIHRDVKPANILLTREGRAKLADFGIAHAPGFEATMGSAATGTVQYMSPEQARGKRVTPLSDLYSTAATLYEARTGRALVVALSDESATEMQMRVGAAGAFAGDVEPPALRAWFAKALAPTPSDRYQTAREMRHALATALTTPSTPAG